MSKEKQQIENSLEGFQFDNETEFFGIKGSGNDVPEIDEIVKKSKVKTETEDEYDDTEDEEEVTPKAKTKKKEVEEVEPTFTFGDPENEDEVEETTTKSKKDEKETKKTPEKVSKDREETDEEEDKKSAAKGETTEQPTDKEFYTQLAQELKEKKIFSIELEEDEELDEEKFVEKFDKEVEHRVDETFEQFFEEMDEDGANFIKFKKNGGKTADFFNAYSTGIDFTKAFDEEDEVRVEETLRYYSANVLQLDAEDTKEKIETLKESGKAKSTAANWFEKLKKADQKLKETLIQQQEEAAKKRQENAERFRSSLDTLLQKTEAVEMFSFSKKDQKELTGYITKPTEKIGKNNFIPQFHNDLNKILRAATKEDQEKLLLLAKLIRSDFKVEKEVVKKVETKVTEKAKKTLMDAKRGIKVSGGSQGGAKKGLADYFPG